MTVFACLCAAASVALGVIYMFAAGAPQRYILINLGALAVGAAAASVIRRFNVRNSNFAGAPSIAIGLLLLTTALFGVRIDGASRWIVVAGISLQPSLILLPVAIVHFASDRNWRSAIGLAIASIGVGLQPDRAMTGTLAAGLGALWLQRRQAPVAVAFVIALSAFAVTLLSADTVAPVPFVEQVVRSAFAFHMGTGLAVLAGLATMLVPAAVGARSSEEREVFVVFGATWLAVIAFAMVGNYPTPLVGYGSSAILGYCASAAMLPR